MLCDDLVKDRPPGVAVVEEHAVIRGLHHVVRRHRLLGNRPLVGALLSLSLAQRTVGIPPVLVRQRIGKGPFARQLQVHHRTVHIRPQLHGDAAEQDLHIAVVQLQRLPEVTVQQRGVVQPDTYTPLLQERIVLIKGTAAAQVEQQFAVFHPYVHADVATAARHRLRRVPARRGPRVVVRLCPQAEGHQDGR